MEKNSIYMRQEKNDSVTSFWKKTFDGGKWINLKVILVTK